MYSDMHAKTNYKAFVDIENLLSLACFVPFLESVKNMIIFAQSLNVHASDFRRALQLCCNDIEGYLQTPVGAHLNDIVWANGRLSVYVIPGMWELVKLGVKQDVKCKWRIQKSP